MSGIAEDGPLHNALVFLDYDRDGQLDKGEPFTYTNDDGTFSLRGKKGYSFTVKTDENTIDTSTGEVLSDVVLTAPSGSSVISPTTTMMEATGLTAAEEGQFLVYLKVLIPLNLVLLMRMQIQISLWLSLRLRNRL